MDSNHRSRKTADLQSAPFGHSGICPNFCHYFRKRICDHFTNNITTLTLSLLSDSNQRPRDYKSRALANWAKEATYICDAVTVVKRVQMYGFFFNHKTFSHFFLKMSCFFIVFMPKPPFSEQKPGKTGLSTALFPSSLWICHPRVLRLGIYNPLIKVFIISGHRPRCSITADGTSAVTELRIFVNLQ